MKKNTLGIVLTFATLGLVSACGPAADSVNSGSTPANPTDPTVENGGRSTPANPYPNFHGGELNGEKNFATLINNYQQGKIEPTPWAGYWWPYTANGIASGTYGGGTSPAGKYDAARGGQKASQIWESRFHGAGVKGIQGWWGHCNGWCAASGLFAEPHESVTVNGVTFDVADIKALLSEAGMSASADFYGNRVDWGNDYNTPKYTDTVPNQYFLVLANYIGKLHHAVLIDRYTGDQVWNQPLGGYRFEYPKPSDYLGASPDAPNVYRILINSKIWWLSDEVVPSVQTPPFNYEDNEVVASRELRMEVWLDGPVVFDANGKITSSGNVIVTRQGDYFVGGAWRMGEGIMVDAWPDYMWVPYSLVKPDPDDDYANPEIDIEWIKNHLLVPGGADDPSASPRPVETAPNPSPTASHSPNPFPTNTSTSNPFPFPTFTSTSTPVPIPTSFPTTFPTVTSTPIPGPTFTSIPGPPPPPEPPGPPAPPPPPFDPAPNPTFTG